MDMALMARIGALREAALAAEKAGRPGEAVARFDEALALAPHDSRLLNSAGGSALRLGDLARAERLYEKAHRLAPKVSEYAINLAVALDHGERPGAALAVLRPLEALAGGEPRYWSARASCERAAGDLAAAGASYERGLALDPRHARSLQGRARVALERGERDAPARYARALEVTPGDAPLWLGRAIALEAAGEVAEARQIGEQLSAQIPGWLDAHRFLAELRLNTEDVGAGTFADHFAAACTKLPDNAELVLAWSSALAGADRFAEALKVAEAGMARLPDNPAVALAAATYASAEGELDLADRHFARLSETGVERSIEEARHRLRRGDPQGAEALAARALAAEPRHVLGWGLRSIAWRMLGDEREHWLHGQEGLVRQLPLEMADRNWQAAIAFLHRLHDESFVPVGQSVRGGSQTRGSLFNRGEPELAELASAIRAVVERYRRELPPRDVHHPLLSRRDEALTITGSWSVRLGPGGNHTVHIHPKGLLSSALYLDLPDLAGDAPNAGALEIGGAPRGIELPPRRVVPARERHLTLFPSTLFHGTRPFAQGRRLTVAFDVSVRGD